MTFDDQIEDEKLQYVISRDTAKISALSLGKIDKYEYLTGEEILPSNRKQVKEPTKCTYSPLGKVFCKRSKNKWRSHRKTKQAISNQGQIKIIKRYAYTDKYSPLISRQKVKQK